MDLNDLSPTERLALQRKNLKQRLGLGSQFMDGNAFFDYNVGGKLIALTVFVLIDLLHYNIEQSYWMMRI